MIKPEGKCIGLIRVLLRNVAATSRADFRGYAGFLLALDTIHIEPPWPYFPLLR
jgi:hypothetical protein